MSKEQPNYYAIIPAKVRYDDSLSSSQKLMFGEFTTLSNKNGFSTASNGYFAKLYNVDNSTVSKWIKGLKKAGYIYVKYERENGQIKSRKIQPRMDYNGIEINQGGIEKSPRGVLKKDQGGIEKSPRGVLKKDQGGIEKSPQYNNTSNNNTRENNSAREESTDSNKNTNHQKPLQNQPSSSSGKSPNQQRQKEAERINGCPVPESLQQVPGFTQKFENYLRYMEQEYNRWLSSQVTQLKMEKLRWLQKEGNYPIAVINQTMDALNKSFYPLRNFDSGGDEQQIEKSNDYTGRAAASSYQEYNEE